MLLSGPTEAAVPAARTLLLGTARTVGELCHILAILEPPPRIMGCLLPQTSEHSRLPAPALGDFEALAEVVRVHRIEAAVISLPLALTEVARPLCRSLDHMGLPWRFIATLGDQMAGRSLEALRAVAPRGAEHGGCGETPSVNLLAGPFVDPLQLLGRKPHALEEASIRQVITAQAVLITGAGGSIGSELARIVARFEPRRLLLVERSENALFEIDREIAHRFPQVDRHALLHDITDPARTMRLLGDQRPQVVFHAAAHKHVPMMEEHPAQALENNFYGTRWVVDAAAAAGVGRMVMISTDKAVNPSSVMGASKRLAELYVQHAQTRGRTLFAMVRFGNVLGSNCSVLPIWARQLSQGQPITVTDARMQRYFMTIPEAAGLVIQSAALARGGEVFLLDMGQPVRIVDLAHRFIRSQGLEPGVDIPVVFTGIRPGEKLHEELAYGGEDMLPTPHAAIRIWKGTPPKPGRMRQIVRLFDRLRDAGEPGGHAWEKATRETVLATLRAAVPEMVAPAGGEGLRLSA